MKVVYGPSKYDYTMVDASKFNRLKKKSWEKLSRINLVNHPRINAEDLENSNLPFVEVAFQGKTVHSTINNYTGLLEVIL